MKKIFIFLSLFLGNYAFTDCPEVLDHEVRLLDSSESVNLCQYEDKVVLAVNVASRCGFTYQYESLQALYEKYAKDDFVILGFPSRDFMFQEYSDESKVKEFCSTEYGVTFPMFATSSVKGGKANSFFKALTEESGELSLVGIFISTWYLRMGWLLASILRLNLIAKYWQKKYQNYYKK